MCRVDDIEPVEQVGAEPLRRNLRLEVDLARGDEAHVERHGLVGAEARDDALLEDAQQLRLQVERHGADLVEQDGAAARMFELAVARPQGAGKGARLMAEQFAFDQVCRAGRRS